MEKLCTIHNVMMKRYTKLEDGKEREWYSHKNADGTYCHGLTFGQAATPPPQPVQTTTADTTLPIQVKEPVKVSATPTPVIISHNLGYAMSYAKDLVMNMQLPINLMFGCAEVMRIYMDGELKVDTAPYRDWIIKQDEKAKEVTKPKKAV